MDFALSEEQNILYNTAKEFGDETIAPNAIEWEKKEEIPRELLKEAGNLGLGGMIVSEEDGGSGMSRLDGTLVFEALAMSCPSVSSFISIHNMSAWVISKKGNQALKDRVLTSILSFDNVCSYCLTEPGSGSDAAALKTKPKWIKIIYIWWRIFRCIRCAMQNWRSNTKRYINAAG